MRISPWDGLLTYLIRYHDTRLHAMNWKTAGKYAISAPLPHPGLEQWWLGGPSADSSSGGKGVWIWPLGDRLQEDAWKANPPSFALFHRHQCLGGLGFQSFREIVRDQGTWFLIADALEGQSLASLVKKKPLPAAKLLSILGVLAGQLHLLHQQQLVHGRLSLQALWYGSQGSLKLLRDPWFLPTCPYSSFSRSLLGPDGWRPEMLFYAAPELALPGQVPTQSSDLYALGCLGYRLLTGRFPFAAADSASLAAAHARQTPERPPDDSCPEALWWCLAHLLAKNPEARFADAMALSQAIQEAKRATPPGIPIESEELAPATSATTAAPSATTRLVAEPSPMTDTRRPRLDLTNTPTRKRSRKKGRRPVWVLPSIIAVCLLTMIGLIVLMTRQGGTQSPTIAKATSDDAAATHSATSKSTNVPTSGTVVAKSPQPTPKPSDRRLEEFSIERDNGRLPWLPPRTSTPYSLDLLPPGAQGFLFLRTESWLRCETGKTILELLDHDLKTAWQDLVLLSGMRLDQIKELTIGMYPGTSGQPRCCWRFTLEQPLAVGQCVQLWANPRLDPASKPCPLWVRDDLPSGPVAYLSQQSGLAESDTLNQFVCGPEELVREAAAVQGAAAPLRRQIELLWQASDSQSDLSLLLSPGFLWTEANGLLAIFPGGVQDELARLLKDRARALLFTTSLEPAWYCELKLTASSPQEAPRLQAVLHDQLESLAEQVERQFVQRPAHPHWRPLAMRFPQMIRALLKYHRLGSEDGVVVSNAYMPSQAAPNLVLASWLSLQLPSDDGPASVPTPTDVVMSIEQILARPIDLRFDQQALETALQSIADECNQGLPPGNAPLRMEIDGGAFERDGITRNKEVRDFQIRQRPARAAINLLVQKANPDSVSELNAESQKVVWVIVDDPKQPSQKMIRLTTRKAAASQSLTLPQEFKP
jgi:serine/threonine protein kinase